MCVRRKVQHRELKLSKSTRFALVTVVMVAVPTGCVVSSPPLFSQNIQSNEKSPTNHRAQGVPPTVSLALGANREGKGRVKGKASRIQSSRIGSALACVRRNAQHPELNFPSTRNLCSILFKRLLCPLVGPPAQVLLPSCPKTYNHTKNPSQALGHEVKQ